MNTPDFINELVENGLDNNTIIDHVQTQQNRIIELEQELYSAGDAILAHKIMYESFLSVKRCGTWFGIYQGDEVPKGDADFSAYELNLLDALQKAVIKLNEGAL